MASTSATARVYMYDRMYARVRANEATAAPRPCRDAYLHPQRVAHQQAHARRLCTAIGVREFAAASAALGVDGKARRFVRVAAHEDGVARACMHRKRVARVACVCTPSAGLSEWA